MVDDIDPHIIGITVSWANNDISTDAEVGLAGSVMFREDRMGRRIGGVLLYVKDTIPAYEVPSKKTTATGGSRLRRSHMVQMRCRR